MKMFSKVVDLKMITLDRDNFFKVEILAVFVHFKNCVSRLYY